jgi:hypothetical protein
MLIRSSAFLALSLFSFAVVAQQPQPQPPFAVPNPDYVSIPMEITVNKPVADVWKRVGKYCDIAEFLQFPGGCQMLSGKDGEIGAVRSVGNEVLVGKTEYSYTYTQAPREGRPYNMYHGTLEARAIDASSSKLIYTVFYDKSLVAGDAAAKEADVERRRKAFTRALTNMKTVCEGGTLPAAPAR